MCTTNVGVYGGEGGKAQMVCDLPMACDARFYAKAASSGKPMNVMDRFVIWDDGIE
jgi:hypothetical protein